MPSPEEDLTTIQGRAKIIAKALDPKNDPGKCGGASPAHCIQRRVLIAIGWLDGKYYEDTDRERVKQFSVPAIRRLQEAIGTPVDGNWGPKTAGKLQRVLEAALGRRVDTAASGQKPGGGAASTAVATIPDSALAPPPNGGG